ncbi:SIR2 family protein [Rhodococcus opacus]|uniref:SIR2 family protein n=1 Tax=Rhodococcus opacus TaxID=37919 RepID=UPI00130085EC|nr:SIR2 family protein [Rhodococcus opacus]
MDDATQELHDLLVSQGSALPVLFVGSGLSRRYIDSPDWEGLLKRFAILAGGSMPYYVASASEDMPKVASLIAQDFFEVWFKDPKYEESRAEFEDQVRRRSDPLKYEITKYLTSLEVLKDKNVKQELAALEKVHAQAVITTNWDEILEGALPDFEVFIGQNDVLFTTLQSVGEIYKIHGSVTDPQSLVLTQEDYADYWNRNPYLIAKMLTLFVEHPVLFFGYSVSDPHIRKLLSNLVECLTPSQLQILNDRMIFVKRGQGDPTFVNGTLTVSDHTIQIREYSAVSYESLYTSLGSLPRKFPPKLMRQLKESVYKLAYDSTAQGRVHVLPIEQDADLDKLEAIIGVGTMDRLGEKGYGHFSREDLILDMVTGVEDHNGELMMSRLVPEIFGTSVKYAPIYYPLYICGRIDAVGNISDVASIPNKAKELIKDHELIQYHVVERSPRRSQKFSELLEDGEKVAILYGTVCVFDDESEVALLRDFLHKLIVRTRKTTTEIARLACRYDRLVYGGEYKGDRESLMSALKVAQQAYQSGGM